MTPENVQKAIDIMAARGVPQEQAMEVLALVATQLQQSKDIAKAARTGLTVDEVRGFESGKAAAQALNAKNGRA